MFGVDCSTVGRRPLDGARADVVRGELGASGRCGSTAGQAGCGEIVLRGFEPAADRGACEYEPDEVLGAGPLAGYCYIDAMQDLNGDGVVRWINRGDSDCVRNPEQVAGCDPSQRRILRIVCRGVEPPVSFGNSTAFIACESSSAL